MFLRLMAIALLLVSCSAPPVPPQVTPVKKPEIGNESRESNENFDESVDESFSEGFGDWLAGFKQKAVQKGIAPEVVESALANVKLVKKVISFDRKQPEKKLTMHEYLNNVINNARIEKGRKLLAENRELLNDISRKTGVEPEFIVALWGLESGYGEKTGDFSIINSLTTLAYEGRRREFFEGELIDALRIIDEQRIEPGDLRGSWAGAMGQCQFMPSSYLTYAVDYDNDGYIDIWNDKADVLASIANYLATVGWGKDEATKEKALKHWNRSTYFVTSVFELAEAIK